METVSNLLKVKPPKYRKDIPHDDSIVGPRFYGVEIEVENCRGDFEHYSKLLHPAWQVKEDHSLRITTKGVPWEFVTVPLHFSQMVPQIYGFYEKTKFTEDNFSDRCSIHVHANVTDFTTENLGALALYYQVLEEVLFSFVGHHRDSNLYCIPWSQCRISHNIVDKLINQESKQTLKAWQKYTALNLIPIGSLGTVEFRQMHGTADIKKIVSWLTIINRIMTEASKTSLDEAIKQIKGLGKDYQYEKFFDRFMSEVLRFDDNQRTSLDTGIINAKYALIDFNGKKPKKASLETNLGFDDLVGTAIITNRDDPDALADLRFRQNMDMLREQQALQEARERLRNIVGVGEAVARHHLHGDTQRRPQPRGVRATATPVEGTGQVNVNWNRDGDFTEVTEERNV